MPHAPLGTTDVILLACVRQPPRGLQATAAHSSSSEGPWQPRSRCARAPVIRQTGTINNVKQKLTNKHTTAKTNNAILSREHYSTGWSRLLRFAYDYPTLPTGR